MADAVLTALSKSSPEFRPNTIRSAVGDEADLSIDVGQPVRPTGQNPNNVLYSDASAEGTSFVLGLAASASEQLGYRGGHVDIQYAGPLTLTTAQWDRVTGESGGLTPGELYYLSNTAGMLSQTPGDNIVQVGRAVSATTMLIQIQYPLPSPP